MNDNEVTVAIASYPKREDGLIDVIYELLPQCDRLCICLNGYDHIPNRIPNNPKIHTVLANDKTNIPDLGCNNKMMWLGKFPGYYATVDDDLHYSPNYIETLKHKVDLYKKKAICSFHGHIYQISNGMINYNRKKMFCFNNIKIDQDIFCCKLGMGVAMCCPQILGLTNEPFMQKGKNFGDDEIMCILAQQKNIPMIRVSSANINVLENIRFSRNASLSQDIYSLAARQKYLESFKHWKLIKSI